MRMMVGIAALFVGCGTAEKISPCTDICGVLVDQCEVASFTSFGECESSCAHSEEQGTVVADYLTCLENVDECDTFGIVECENEHGW
jgi:hypothetical protein